MLRADMLGHVSPTGHPQYNQVRLAWNLIVDQHLFLIVIPQDAADLVTSVQFARQAGLDIAA